MASSEAAAEADRDEVTEKEHMENRNFCGKSAEEVRESTSSGSMKSPVTPAAFCESNGTPALRWKSYTKQKEADGHEKLAGFVASSADGKGKLVINLCGSTRSVPKLSPTSSEVKASQCVSKHLEATASSQENGLPLRNEDDDARSSRALLDIVPSQNMPSGSSESVQNCVTNPHTFKGSNATRNLAKMVSRRIRVVRQTLKKSKRPRPFRIKPRLHAMETVALEINGTGVASHLSHGCQDAVVGHLHKEECSRRKTESRDHAAVEEPEDPMGSEEVIYSEDEGMSLDLQSHGKVLEAVASMGPTESVDDKIEASITDVANAGAGIKEMAPVDLPYSQHILVAAKDIECPAMDITGRDHNYGLGRARSLSHEAGGISESSKLDVKEQTVLETLLRDEPTGYSSGGGSEPSRSHRVERSGCDNFAEKSVPEDFGQLEESESSDAESDCSQSDGYDEGDSSYSESHECDDKDCNCNGLPPSSLLLSPRKGVRTAEQVPSVLCDAEGNIWHIGKRAQQASMSGLYKQLRSSSKLQESTLGIAGKGNSMLPPQEHNGTKILGQRITPYSNLIDSNWKWPSDADYTINSMGEFSCRSMVHKEKAIFVGCIPDGTENLEEILQQLMENFLERFDFAPAILSQIQLVKAVKDIAFLELATEKVAHIVLAANQLDVFEWGVNGFHFNIEGCKGTHTSVRPLIEYMPLKPARVIFVGNIPKSRWQKDYLEGFFARILKGSDAPEDCNLVSCVYLLPESCDAYVELALEVMADSIIFKCSKNPLILKEIGEDVFICRDPSSVPLMSKHKGNICPQRSLFVGVSAPGQEFKIDLVRKVFEEILPMISRETNQPGYLEFISVQPGKDYAFFQFNSESIVDAFLEEYVANTHLFVINNTSVSYIILRPPAYKRPGARYRTDKNRNGLLATQKFSSPVYLRCGSGLGKQAESMNANQGGMVPLVPRRFGDEPAKRTDCILAIGASPLPEATWNGLSSAGSCAADPECMLIIEGLPKGVSCRLLRGALNELFEASLSKTGLLEAGMLVVRHLDRDSNLNVVASLPNSRFVKALLSLKKTLIVAGNELKLLPKVGKRKVTWEGKIAEHTRGQGETSCLSDDELYCDEPVKYRLGNGTIRPSLLRRKRELSSMATRVHNRKKLMNAGKEIEWDPDLGCTENLGNISTLLQKKCTSDIKDALKVSNCAAKVLSRQKVGTQSLKAIPGQQRIGTPLKQAIPYVQNIAGPLKFGKRVPTADVEEFPDEILHIVSEGGKRKIRRVSSAPKVVYNSGNARFLEAISKKRNMLHSNDSTSLTKVLAMRQSFKKLRQASHVL